VGNIFNIDFQEFLRALNSANVKYVLVGGYSVIYHGFPRTTGDLDIFVEVSGENYLNIEKAFVIFGMPTFDMTKDNFLYNDNVDVFSFGRSPVSIELLKKITGLSFKEVYEQAINTEMEGIALRVINLNHLKENKLKSGRNKDLNDLENLP
jgi:predicted nucleotidyltransferase